jgi:hypothetical protein
MGAPSAVAIKLRRILHAFSVRKRAHFFKTAASVMPPTIKFTRFNANDVLGGPLLNERLP